MNQINIDTEKTYNFSATGEWIGGMNQLILDTKKPLEIKLNALNKLSEQFAYSMRDAVSRDEVEALKQENQSLKDRIDLLDEEKIQAIGTAGSVEAAESELNQAIDEHLENPEVILENDSFTVNEVEEVEEWAPQVGDLVKIVGPFEDNQASHEKYLGFELKILEIQDESYDFIILVDYIDGSRPVFTKHQLRFISRPEQPPESS